MFGSQIVLYYPIVCILLLSLVYSEKVNAISPTPKNVSQSCDCGESIAPNPLHWFDHLLVMGDEPIPRFIVNGRKIPEDQHPFLAYVKRQGYLECGGSVINSRYVLTAAHCIEDGDTEKDFSVVLGLHNRLDPEDHSREYKVEKIKKHGEYKRTETAILNDITLLRLDQDIVYSKFVQTICLPPAEMIGDVGYVQGWGKRGEGLPTTPRPMQASLQILSGQECSTYPVDLGDPQSVLCAQDVYSDACKGDSGGPLITLTGFLRASVLSGIVSYGVGCAQPGYPGVYTKVEAFLDWIYLHTKDAVYCSRKRIDPLKITSSKYERTRIQIK